MDYIKPLAKATMNNRKIQAKSIKLKKSLDEVMKILGEGKQKSKRKGVKK